MTMTKEHSVRNFTINFGPEHPSATAFCAWFWSLTAKSSSAPTRISACCIAAPKS